MKRYAFRNDRGRWIRMADDSWTDPGSAASPASTVMATTAVWPADLIGDDAVAICEPCEHFRTKTTGVPFCMNLGGCEGAVRYVAEVRVRGCPIGKHESLKPKD